MAFNFDAPDLYVELARYSVEELIGNNRYAMLPEGLPDELLAPGHGAFASLHRRGKLRGCIGTMEACQPCIGEEILHNARSAATRDPRFPAIKAVELDEIEYSVDVLTVPKPATIDQLDPKKFGVMVRHGGRCGVLLPDLDGVDTVDDQLSIACRKAGISVPFEELDVYRFEVVRHSAGGASRAGV